jgi:hypothetical protein
MASRVKIFSADDDKMKLARARSLTIFRSKSFALWERAVLLKFKIIFTLTQYFQNDPLIETLSFIISNIFLPDFNYAFNIMSRVITGNSDTLFKFMAELVYDN